MTLYLKISLPFQNMAFAEKNKVGIFISTIHGYIGLKAKLI